MSSGTETQHTGPWDVKITLWKPVHGPGRTREERTSKGFYDEETKVDVINAILYDIRGDKSAWNLAYVDEIEPAEGFDE